jgi:ubiquinone/menaquinone biosynthesis C-methylase UbiE
MSFDPMAAIYDETRVIDSICFNSALDFLVQRFPPLEFNKLFEPGIGTGRIAIPLAERGYRVTGVDISEDMLKILSEKLRGRNSPLAVAFQKADVTALPFPDMTFDIAVAVHVFHLIRDWKKAVAEVLRVLKPDAPLIMLFTGSGDEIPAIKDRYREICVESGHSARHIGLTGGAELQDYLSALGRNIETIDNRWRWTQRIRVNEALSHMRSHYYSFTNLIPETVHMEAIERLQCELQKQYGNLSTVVEVPTQVNMVLIQPSTFAKLNIFSTNP